MMEMVPQYYGVSPAMGATRRAMPGMGKLVFMGVCLVAGGLMLFLYAATAAGRWGHLPSYEQAPWYPVVGVDFLAGLAIGGVGLLMAIVTFILWLTLRAEHAQARTHWVVGQLVPGIVGGVVLLMVVGVVYLHAKVTLAVRAAEAARVVAEAAEAHALEVRAASVMAAEQARVAEITGAMIMLQGSDPAAQEQGVQRLTVLLKAGKLAGLGGQLGTELQRLLEVRQQAFLETTDGRDTLIKVTALASTYKAKTLVEDLRAHPEKWVNIQGAGAVTAMRAVISMGRVDALATLMRRGLDVKGSETVGEGEPWVAAACFRDSVPMIRALVAAGCPVNEINAFGVAGIHVAGRRGSAEMVEALVASGADVNLREGGKVTSTGLGNTPVIEAVWGRNVAALKALIGHGADVNLRNAMGDSALDVAGRLGIANGEMGQVLRKAGAGGAGKAGAK